MMKLSKQSSRISASGKKRGIKLGAIERGVLEDLYAGDLFVGFLLSARSTREMYRVARERAMKRYRTKKAIERLIEDGLIRKIGEALSITKSGRDTLDETVRSVRRSLKERRWDGKWRIVIYDIPERMRALRHALRSTLKRAGFVMLQNSVWVFPHDCEELTSLIKERSEIGQYVLYGVLDRIEDEKRLRKFFSL